MMKKTKQSKVYHNTVLLLRSYKNLKEHIDGSESLIKIENQALEDWTSFNNTAVTFEDYLKSTKKTKTVTIAMIRLVERYLKLYKADAKKRNDANKLIRYQVIDLKYISKNYSIEEIANSMGKDISTIQRYHRKAIEELGVYFFGIEGLKLERIDECSF